ncbi:uncharacterized protein LOC119663239, partial [Teleopsis dalmanni]|uniref:uncharacterized protein LOC119663239 n=1 Tax=Teleopsis dalmanni TaxID=139649 RepID=UPI0018CF7FAD
MKFLVDTGSAVSIIPLAAITVKRNLVPDELKLFAANNSFIKTYGTKRLSINLGLRRSFNWNFIIADVKCPILGADFLAKYGLIPDIKSRRLLDPLTTLSSSGAIETTSIHSVYTLDPNSKFFTIVNKYIDLCSANNYSLPDASVVCHQIVTDGQPVHERSRRYSTEKLKAIREEFSTLLEQGIIRPSNSPWSSPIHL